MKVQCTNCREVLQIDNDLAGQKVRCPKCEYIVQVEFDGSTEIGDTRQDKRTNLTNAEAPPLVTELTDNHRDNATNEEASPPATEWFLRIPEGYDFGPISLSELDKWVSQGRVATGCEIRNEQVDWQPAADFYPELLGNEAAQVDQPLRRIATAQAVPTVLESHRGAFILSLAFAGCIIPFLSVWPAVIGTRDLQRMSVGKMDLRGEAMTRSGQAIAMVASMIWFGAFGIGLLTALIGAMGGVSG